MSGFSFYSVDIDKGFWWVDAVYVEAEHRPKGILHSSVGSPGGASHTAVRKTIACEVAKGPKAMRTIPNNSIPARVRRESLCRPLLWIRYS